MSTFSDIMIDIEELWSEGKFSDEIAEIINKRYATALLSSSEVDNVIRDFLDAREQAYNDDMDGDFDSAMASAGFGTDEDYGYYGE